MKLALEQAKLAFKADEVPVGCVFVQNTTKQVVAASHNLTNSFKNASRHCEVNCITEMAEKGRVDFKELSLFVTVEPCIMCAHALNLMGVGQVYFGQYNDRFGGCGSVLKSSSFEWRGGILEKESLEVLKSFYERGNQRIP